MPLREEMFDPPFPAVIELALRQRGTGARVHRVGTRAGDDVTVSDHLFKARFLRVAQGLHAPVALTFSEPAS